ncbi:hypothetical protein NDU88_004811 [Pleurodeles waltl]|uniref:Uncharacterized protein n=1 Tax=Pleurodeles waltl TaxID=8319 RepID=A0AAV7PKV9_PLEWA|nr:hypothetical protein NDU88_004811 [Pleurodeles waltl]
MGGSGLGKPRGFPESRVALGGVRAASQRENGGRAARGGRSTGLGGKAKLGRSCRAHQKEKKERQRVRARSA